MSAEVHPTDRIDMTGINSQMQTLQAAIEFSQESHRVTGQNLANVNTPGYQAQEVSFDQVIEALDRNGNGNGKPSIADVVEVRMTQGLANRADGNNVDLDRELAMMKKNALAFQTLTQLLGSKMSILDRSITG